MWIMHPEFGFLSIVKKPEDQDTLTVRSRSRAHLEAFLDSAGNTPGPNDIQENAGTDYAFRAVLPQELVANMLEEHVLGIDYSNFKSESKNRGQPSRWLEALGRIWRVHFSFQRDTA